MMRDFKGVPARCLTIFEAPSFHIRSSYQILKGCLPVSERSSIHSMIRPALYIRLTSYARSFLHSVHYILCSSTLARLHNCQTPYIFLTSRARSFLHSVHYALWSSTLARLHIYQTPCIFLTSYARLLLHSAHYVLWSSMLARLHNYQTPLLHLSIRRARSALYIYTHTKRLWQFNSFGSVFPI